MPHKPHTMYTLASCEMLISKYVNEYKGECLVLEEGILGLGTILLHGAENKKSILIKEVYLNPWNSGHTIRMYNKLPKKLKQHIN
jgi:hypothetical protein